MISTITQNGCVQIAVESMIRLLSEGICVSKAENQTLNHHSVSVDDLRRAYESANR